MSVLRWRRRVDRRPRIVLDEAPARLVRQRRDAALAVVGDEAAVRARIESAPPGYLLSHEDADIARHCELLEPRPAADEVRVALTPAAAGWCVDVAAVDRRGLLAAVTGALAARDVDVAQAVIATWDDGAVLDAFVVRAARVPDADDLQRAIAAALREPLVPARIAGADVVFHDGRSRWYTRCDVRVPDQPGLFHALATAISRAGADVHAARATTADGEVLDVFDLTDTSGRKLSATLKDAIATRIAVGAAPGTSAPGTSVPGARPTP